MRHYTHMRRVPALAALKRSALKLRAYITVGGHDTGSGLKRLPELNGAQTHGMCWVAHAAVPHPAVFLCGAPLTSSSCCWITCITFSPPRLATEDANVGKIMRRGRPPRPRCSHCGLLAHQPTTKQASWPIDKCGFNSRWNDSCPFSAA